mmetsp:Transcript_18803/g.21387  ORF Transcript_18803/g.21387 Transcript_18803/m.21387 type:complete len:291 (+) Transcript_18803:145-1017(+)
MAGTRRNNRSEDPINGIVKTLVGLTDQECTHLITTGITSLDDLSYLTFEDIDATISVIKRRKLDLVAKYLAATEKNNVYSLPTGTNMSIIRKYLNDATNKKTQEVAVTRDTRGGGGGGNEFVSVYGTPEVSTDPMEKISGDPVDFEEWHEVTETTLSQTSNPELINAFRKRERELEKEDNNDKVQRQSTASPNKKRKATPITTSSLQPSGIHKIRLDSSLDHFPEPSKKHARCNLHRWAGVETTAGIMSCATCNTNLCLQCFKMFHTDRHLAEKREQLKKKYKKIKIIKK